MRRILHIMAIFGLLACAARAQTPVSASISTAKAAVNEIFHVTISANGSDVSEPDLSALAAEGVQLGTPSVQSSTSIQSTGGRTNVMQSRTWRYPASIAREGTFTLPRIPVTVDGQEYLTPPMTIEITRAVDMGVQAPDGTQEITVEDLAFVRAVTDKTTLYQGEALTLRARLYMLDGNYVNVEGPRSLPMPDTEGFYPGPQWQNTLTEQLYGRSYRVTEFGWILYPAMPGDLTIGAWNWQGRVRWHDARRRMQSAARMFSTNPIPITVLPLPERPAGFGGAVGKFRLQAQLAQQALVQGRPVRFNISISGEGNPNTVSAPALPELPWAHVSGPETDTQQQENSPAITKTFSYLITPLEIGDHTIPQVPFTFFAPLIKNYKTEYTPEFAVTVAAPEGAEAFVAVGGAADRQRSQIEVFESGILPVITDPAALTVVPRATAGGRLTTAALLSPILPLAAYLGLSFFLAWRGRLSRDRGYARRFYAKSRCLKALKAAHNAADPTEALDQALTGYIADMLNINEAGLTSSDVEALLRERGVPDEATQVTARVLRACERARYAGRDSGEHEVDALFAAADNAVEQLQTALQEKRS